MTWERVRPQGYYVVPVPAEEDGPSQRCAGSPRIARRTRPTGARRRGTAARKGLQTMSGKIEFVASSLKRLEATGTVDPERPAMGPQYFESWEGHHTTTCTGSTRCSWYRPIPSSASTPGDAKDSWMNEVKDSRVLVDGYYYWILRVNSKDAAARGIADGDLVRAFNDRGSVILSRRSPSGCRRARRTRTNRRGDYEALGEPGHSPDIAGCVNILTPKRFITPLPRPWLTTPAQSRWRNGTARQASRRTAEGVA